MCSSKKDSIEKQLHPIIRINCKKTKKKTERKCYKIRSGAVMQPGLTTSRRTVRWALRLDTRGAERHGEDESANATPLE